MTTFRDANQIPLETVFGHYAIQLKHYSSSRAKASSPFTSDSDPSLVVYTDTNTWWDYSTQQGSTVIDLITKIDHCDPLEALKKACQIGGLVFKESHRQQSQRTQLEQALAKQDPTIINQLDAVLDVLKWWSKDDPSLKLAHKVRHYQHLIKKKS